MFNDPVNLVDPWGENPAIIIALWIIGLTEYTNAPAVGETPKSGLTNAAILLPFGRAEKAAEDICHSFNYSQKVIEQMDRDIYHGFPSIIDKIAIKHGIKRTIRGADGINRTEIVLPGSINGRSGAYQWIIEPNGIVNHRLFNTRIKIKE